MPGITGPPAKVRRWFCLPYTLVGRWEAAGVRVGVCYSAGQHGDAGLCNGVRGSILGSHTTGYAIAKVGLLGVMTADGAGAPVRVPCHMQRDATGT